MSTQQAEKNNDKTSKTIKAAGIAIAIVVAAIVVPIIFDEMQVSNGPWWGKTGSTDRLLVKKCKNTECTDYEKSTFEVLYNGRFSKKPSSDAPKETVAFANDGLSWLNEDAIYSWSKEVNIENPNPVDKLTAIDGFQIAVREDRKNSIQTYGYCHRDHEIKSCIVFSEYDQYRFEP